jgi:copper chaperone
MLETVFLISGMKCQGCAAAVSQALEQVTGYESASVDLENGTATVTGQIDPQSVCMLLAEAGYPSVVKSG